MDGSIANRFDWGDDTVKLSFPDEHRKFASFLPEVAKAGEAPAEQAGDAAPSKDVETAGISTETGLSYRGLEGGAKRPRRRRGVLRPGELSPEAQHASSSIRTIVRAKFAEMSDEAARVAERELKTREAAKKIVTKWDESQHPRDEHGKFADDGGAESNGEERRSWQGLHFREETQQQPLAGDSAPKRTEDGDFIVYHSTSPDVVGLIEENGLKPDNVGLVGFGTRPGATQIFGSLKSGQEGRILELVVDQKWLGENTDIIKELNHKDLFLFDGKGDGKFEGVPRSAIKQIRDVTEDYREGVLKLAKAFNVDAIVNAIMAALAGYFAALPDDVTDHLDAAARAGVESAIISTAITDEGMITRGNEAAREFASRRAAELVGMRRLRDGSLIANPSAKWQITETVRDSLRGILERAFAAETPLEQIIESIRNAGAFSDYRAEMIARTEAARAQTQGVFGLWQQTGMVQTYDWLTSESGNVCPECQALAAGGPYEFGSGPMPPDDSHPNCLTCGTVIASFDSVEGYTLRWFDGEVTVLKCLDGEELTVTPNHPVLTSAGWVPAGQVEKGAKLVKCVAVDKADLFPIGQSPYYKLMPTVVEEVFSALLKSRKVTTVRVKTRAEDFHGDGVADGEVYIVNPNGFLPDVRDSVHAEQAREQTLVFAEGGGSALNSASAPASVFSGSLHSPDSVVGVLGEPASVAARGVSVSQRVGFVESPEGNTKVVQPARDDYPGGSEFLSEVDESLSGFVELAEVIGISRQWYFGHVFNLQTASGYYTANGFLVSNCQCIIAAAEIEEKVVKGAKPKCPHCGSTKYELMPTDFETAKCKDCGRNWHHGIVPGINDPSDKVSKGDVEGHPFRGNQYTEGGGSSSKATAYVLNRKISSHGGKCSVEEGDDDLQELVTEGKVASGQSAQQVYETDREMQANQCHRNAGRLFVKGKASAIGTGYALSKDGIWRQHSWGIDKQGQILETTSPRTKYFGITLSGKEAHAFVKANPWVKGMSPAVQDHL